MMLLQLFLAFFQIGLFSIGGGYAIIPMISDQVVVHQHWLTAQEFTDIITISQMTPGPLAVNTSTFVGMRVAGIAGALCATIGCICMGVLIAYGIYHIFQKFSTSKIFMEVLKGLKAGSLGLIMAAAAIILSLAFFKEGVISTDSRCHYLYDYLIYRKKMENQSHCADGIIRCYGRIHLSITKKTRICVFFMHK